jgi:hypothetical protein
MEDYFSTKLLASLIGLMFQFNCLSLVLVQSLGSILSPIMPRNVQRSRFKPIVD